MQEAAAVLVGLLRRSRRGSCRLELHLSCQCSRSNQCLVQALLSGVCGSREQPPLHQWLRQMARVVRLTEAALLAFVFRARMHLAPAQLAASALPPGSM